MRICNHCGATLTPGDAFCPKCGAKAVEPPKPVCPNCQAEVAAGSLFCNKCGCKLGGGAAAKDTRKIPITPNIDVGEDGDTDIPWGSYTPKPRQPVSMPPPSIPVPPVQRPSVSVPPPFIPVPPPKPAFQESVSRKDTGGAADANIEEDDGSTDIPFNFGNRGKYEVKQRPPAPPPTPVYVPPKPVPPPTKVGSTDWDDGLEELAGKRRSPWPTIIGMVVISVVAYIIYPMYCKDQSASSHPRNGQYFTDQRDGKKYNTVTIDSRKWMAENLNYTLGNSSCYGDKSKNCNKYGRLYDWNTAMAACPSGWHLPSRGEWEELAKTVGGTGMHGDSGMAGKRLKSINGWRKQSNGENGNGTDELGFSAIPSGFRGSTIGFLNLGFGGHWWTATQYGTDEAYDRKMSNDNDYIGENNSEKNYGFAVRCVEGDALKAVYTETVNGYTFEMVPVTRGTFEMGCVSEQGNKCYWDEEPAHFVTISDYYIGKYEVTQGLWNSIMGNNPSYFKGTLGSDNLPVEYVTWYDVQRFIQKLNQLTGKTYRLPTEAEWEYAARGGASGQGYMYSGSNTIDNVAWYNVNSGDRVLRDDLYQEYVIEKKDIDGYRNILNSNKNRTRYVGAKLPNELGIYDMTGNVWEWVSDWYGNYQSTQQNNPIGPTTGSERVIRGGGWLNATGYCRVYFRQGFTPDSYLRDAGFRLVLSP